MKIFSKVFGIFRGGGEKSKIEDKIYDFEDFFFY